MPEQPREEDTQASSRPRKKQLHTQKAREETGAAQQKQIAEGQAPRCAAAKIQHSEHYHVNKNPIVNSDRSLSYRGFSDDERKLGVTWKQRMAQNGGTTTVA